MTLSSSFMIKALLQFVTQLLPGPTDFSRYGSVPLLCDITSLVDQVLTTASMFYLAILR